MIDRKKAKAKGVVTIDGNSHLQAKKEELRDKLRALLPALVNSDGSIDAKALKDSFDIANSSSNSQGYELTFAGKGLARAAANTPTECELKAECKQSKKFYQTGNVVIRGDNIEALKILRRSYHGKIKMIYIDPPYNTESDNFIHKDNFKQSDEALIEEHGLDEKAIDFIHNVYGTRSHSGWLSFMYPRLKLARELLSDDGVIFISIDDNEMANLKIICDEIFGEDNFVSSLIHQKKSGGGQAKYYYKGHDTILVYSRLPLSRGLEKLDDRKYKTIEIDGKVYWYDTDVIRRHHGRYSSKEGHRNVPYEDLPTKAKKSWDEKLSKKEFILVFDKEKKKHFVSRYGLINEKKKLLYSILMSDSNYNLWTSCGQTRVDGLLGMNCFSNPKPVDLVKMFGCCVEKNEIVLDFFAGSGTTGDAVMQLNAEDGGNRKFILVQWDEKIDKEKSGEAYAFCVKNKFKPVISSITIERLNRAGERIKAGAKKENAKLLIDGGKPMLDIGYKVYSLTPKPAFEGRPKRGKSLQLTLKNPREKAMDKLSNMLCAIGETLDTPIVCIKENKIYKVGNALYLFGNASRKELEGHENCNFYLDGWADIDLTAFLNMGFHDKGQKDKLKVVY